MSQEIPERWRLLYSAVTSGDLDGIMEFFHDDVEYLPFEESETIHGLDAVRRYFEGWLDTWDLFQAEPTEFLDRGDHVVVGEALKGRGKGSGVEVATQQWSVSLEVVRRLRPAPRPLARECRDARDTNRSSAATPPRGRPRAASRPARGSSPDRRTGDRSPPVDFPCHEHPA